MSQQAKGNERTARSDLERITIFRDLADEYLDLIDAVGVIHEPGESSDQAMQNRTALSLRLMLERKFVSSNDTNTYIPGVIEALKRSLKDDQGNELLNRRRDEYNKVISGESTGISVSFNNVELDFENIRQIFAYGRLMHSDRDKHISSDVLSRLHFDLLVRQSTLLAATIASLRDCIVAAIESGVIPRVCESLKETWHEIYADPEMFGLGARMSSDEIPALRDAGSQPLPGGSRKRTVSFVIPELGRWIQPKPRGDG